MKEIRLCTIEYTTKDNVNWKANILAEDIEEAVKLIRDNVNNVDKVWSTSAGLGSVHAITDSIRKRMTVIKEVGSVGDTNVDGYSCPWCDKTFKTAKGCQIHITKTHTKTKK